jgi:hypothetical protein
LSPYLGRDCNMYARFGETLCYVLKLWWVSRVSKEKAYKGSIIELMRACNINDMNVGLELET